MKPEERGTPGPLEHERSEPFDPGAEIAYLRGGSRDFELEAEVGAAPFDPGPDRYDTKRARRRARRRRRELQQRGLQAGPIDDGESLGGMRRLATAGAVGILGAAGTALFGWLRTKGLAVALGPAGVGLYGQLWSFVLYAGQLASLGIGVGATALIATEHERGDREGLGLAGSLTLAIPVAAGLTVLALSLVTAPFLAPILLDSSDVLLLVLAALSIPFVAVQGPLQHLIQGMEDAVGQAVTYLIYGAGFAVLAVVGAFVADVEGAAVGLTLGNVLLAGLYLSRSRTLFHRVGARLRTRTTRLRGALRSETGRALLRVGAGSLIITVVFGVADLGVRTVLLRTSGESVAGYWYALLLISVQFVGMLAGALSWLAVPLAARLDERSDTEAIGRVLDDSVRLVCLVVFPVLAVLCALRDPIVDILFTSEFSAISKHLPAQLAGDMLRTLAWTLGVALVPLGYVTAWVLLGVGSSVILGVLGGFLASQNGLDGAVTAWVIMWGVTLIATVAVVARGGYWRPTARSTFGVVAGAAALGGATLAPGVPGVLIAAAALGATVLLATRRSERQAAFGLIRSYLPRT
jgi:O-antigen/teichoic acid export membrane protein